MRVQHRCLITAFALVALVAPRHALADPPRPYAYVTPFGGYTIFDKQLKFPGVHKLENRIYMGGRAGVQLNSWFGIEGAGGFVSTEEDTVEGPKVKFTHLSGNLVFRLIPMERGGLFWSEGFGWGRLKAEGGPKDSDLDQGLLESALALRVPVTHVFGLRFEGRHQLWIPKDEIRKAHFKYITFGVGLEFSTPGGPPSDMDQDGVPDRKDHCPNTPVGCHVDENGCPTDADGDGVCDGVDQCPNTPHAARVDLHGCPLDADRDGVADGIDTCPDTPSGCHVDAKGCPVDADGDGVCDGLDQCADTPAGSKVDERGCPVVVDSDNDGVPDDRDKCPNTAIGLKVDADGCPIEVIERETELMDTGMIRLENVHFVTAKWDIMDDDKPRLDVVGQVLVRWPELRIEIGGHTDFRGSIKYNQGLSENRARSVRDYLLSKFPDLKASQYTVHGYGELKPIAPNGTDAGMAKNRRVEFKVLNREVLKKEAQRRRLLKTNESAPPDTTQH